MEDKGQSVETNSFLVTNIGDLSESSLREALACQQIKFYTWELAGEKRRFAEVLYHSIAEAEQAYNQLSPLEVEGQELKFLVKRAWSTLWVAGLPSVVYSRDLFTSLMEVTNGLVRVSIVRNPE